MIKKDATAFVDALVDLIYTNAANDKHGRVENSVQTARAKAIAALIKCMNNEGGRKP